MTINVLEDRVNDLKERNEWLLNYCETLKARKANGNSNGKPFVPPPYLKVIRCKD